MFKGEIKKVPEEIVVKMLELQVEQGNAYNVSVFENDIYAQRSVGGFNWEDTEDGGGFWERVLEFEGFKHFFIV
jgi:hypothetical protein